MSMPIPPRTTTLDPGEPLTATIDIGRPWWEPIGPWPDGMRFTDVDAAVLELERRIDSCPLSPPPAPSRCYGSSGLMAVESRFAEPEIGRAA